MNDEITAISSCLLNGGAVVIPTDTVFGLAASPLHQAGVDKIFELKMRSKTQNLPIMVASQKQLDEMGVELNEVAIKCLNSQFMPGALTLVLGFKTEPTLDWLKGREEIAIRIPNNERLLAVLEKTGPLLVTSANRNGSPFTPDNIPDILAELNGTPDLIIDGTPGESQPSTIVNCRVNPPTIQRQGIIPNEILNLLHSE
jgi:L-threonylcarbamoyladenylate synthase